MGAHEGEGLAVHWISFLGMAVIVGIAVALSTNRRKISPRIVLSAFALQAGVAALVLYVPAGKAFIEALSEGVRALLEFSNAGINMVFGPLADTSSGISFAVHVLPIVIFFASLMSVLYHLGVMQIVVRAVGGAIRRILGTEAVESLNAAANIFVGQTEAPLVVRPYLGRLTEPQLFAVMVSGLASVAGTVLAAYAKMGIPVEYLLAASFMAAPGGLLMAKIIMPDEDPDAPDEALNIERVRDANVILAAANGARDGVRLAVNIGAMLIAFVALIALFNGIVGGIGGWFGYPDVTLEKLLGELFAPLMWLLSVPWSEAHVAGALFGEKLILNEFVAYFDLSTKYMDSLSPHSLAVVTFSLCGFANLSSIAILLGGLGSLVPEKRDLIAKFGLRAVAAGSLSNLMSAALASLLVGV
ncbi:MAG: NupC/NupG family nucleoside CNT transporter [Alphaproteobacteria bacterium]|nr:MAG: NupC/NupG family nucleoside CNT transporter [Alphaproteobacteria bacterium]